MSLSIIAAFDDNQLIGNGPHLPWHLPEDLAYFKQTTRGKTIVMGRKTYESIGHPLPHRTNIVISSQLEEHPGITILRHPDELMTNGEIFIIGGADIFKYFLPKATRLYITHIDHQFQGDIYFPTINWSDWLLTSNIIISQKKHTPYNHRYCIYQRQNCP